MEPSVVRSVDLMPNYGFAEVDPDEVDAFLSGLEGAEVRGKSLKAERAKSRRRRRRRDER